MTTLFECSPPTQTTRELRAGERMATADDLAARREQPDLLLAYIREAHGMPESWRVISWNCAPEVVPPGFLKVEGAVCPLKEHNIPNWRKRERGTERVLFVDTVKAKAFSREYAAKIGKCVECFVWGSGWSWAGTGTDGTRVWKCQTCGGTGKPTGEQP